MIRKLLALAASLLAAATLAPTAQADRTASSFRDFDASSIAAIQKANAGRAFVLAFWSIHCGPCIEDMSDWRALQRQYPAVPIVLVTTDPPAERAKAARMLTQYRPGPVQTWGFADEFAERVRFSVDRRWRGELPRTYFYDAEHRSNVRSGRLDLDWTTAWFKQQDAANHK